MVIIHIRTTHSVTVDSVRNLGSGKHSLIEKKPQG